MATVGGEETLRRFVLRARRVHAHSIAQDWGELLRHAHGSFDGYLDLGRSNDYYAVPPADEEVFESLASRVRPLPVKSSGVPHSGVAHQRHDNAAINLARYEKPTTVVGPVGAAVKRGADRKTGPRPAGGREARKGSHHPVAEQPRDGVLAR